MAELDRQRFERMLPERVARKVNVTLVGCGGIGSYTAGLVARMGVGRLKLVDFDKVEATNVATQDLSPTRVGEYKVTAVGEWVGELNEGMEVGVYPERFGAHHLDRDSILVLAVDSIEARRGIYEVWKEDAEPGQVLVDPRMGAESFEMWVVRRGSEFEEEYTRALYDPTPRAGLPCGARAIAYTGAFAGALTTSAIRRAVMEKGWETWVVGDVGAMRMQVLREIKGETN